jgi:hypothetical protein
VAGGTNEQSMSEPIAKDVSGIGSLRWGWIVQYGGAIVPDIIMITGMGGVLCGSKREA